MRKQPSKFKPVFKAHQTAGFTVSAQKAAMREGWCLVYVPATNTFDIQRWDLQSWFEDDTAARRFVRYNKRDATKPHRNRAWMLAGLALWQWDKSVPAPYHGEVDPSAEAPE